MTMPYGSTTADTAESPTVAPDTTKPQDELEPDGELLTETDEAKICRKVEYYWAADDRRMARRKAVWRRNGYWRDGVRSVYLVADDRDENVNVYAPPATAILPPVPNLTDRLCRRVTAQLLADPALPEATPGSQEDQAAAEHATTILRYETGEHGANFRKKGEAASDMAHTFGSSFAYCCLDPHGGGWEPMDVYAHPNAINAEAPLDDPEPPTIEPDPMQAEQMAMQGIPPQPQPNPKHIGPTNALVRRYVMPDGTLSERPAGAKRRWLPKNQWMLMTGQNVRMIPHTVTTGIEDAQGVVLCVPTTLGELKSKFEAVRAMNDEQIQELAAYRPPKYRDLQRGKHDDPQSGTTQIKTSESGVIEDDTVCYPLTLYFKSHYGYPKGAYLVCAGRKVLHKQAWAEELEDGSEECLDIPLSQCKDLDVPTKSDPYGQALSETLGMLDEIHAQLWIYVLEYLAKANNPLVYLPASSPAQAEAMRRRDGTPIDVMSKDDMPVYEELPSLPPQMRDIIQAVEAQLNSEAGLEESAQGVAAPSVKSGTHAQQIIEQALVALGIIKRNLDDFLVRMWRIDLMFRRVFYTTPQRMRYEGDDQVWREQEWSRSDLLGVRDVRIARGTSTMLTQSAKQALASEQLQLGVMSLEEYQDMTANGVSTILGYQQNAARNRVRRQIAEWKQGPDEETAQDPMAVGQAAAALFAPLPCDEEPLSAKTRFYELSKAMASTAYLDQPPEWRAPFDQAYLTARQNAGVMTVPEQMAQQQAMQEQQMMQQQQQQDAAAGERAETTDREERKMQLEREKMQMQQVAA